MSELKNVVIIGAASAGANAARALEKQLPPSHRLVLIDAHDHAFWPIASLRAAVVPGWEDQVYQPLAGFFSPSSRHVILPKTKVVELGEGYVVVDVDNADKGFGTKIEFEACVLALGSTYDLPMRSTSNDLNESKQTFKDLQVKVANAQKIVIAGGGACGIELAGEILAHLPKKDVTLVHSGGALLSQRYPPKLAAKLLSQVSSAGAKVALNEHVDPEVIKAGKGTVKLSDGTVIEADLVFFAGGTTPNTSLVRALDPSALDAKGFVIADEYLKVKSETPSPLTKSFYLVAGDAAASEYGPTAIKAGEDVKAIAKNVLAHINGTALTKVGAPANAIVIPVGPSSGSSLLPYIGVLGGWFTSFAKGKTLFVSMFTSVYTPK